MSYVTPTSTTPVSGNLTLTQFIQTVLVGISGLPGALVRPNWQVAPPKQPDIATDWLAFGIDISAPDANSYIAPKAGAPLTSTSQRNETLEIGVSIYGPEALSNYGLLRDGFQIQQNLLALQTAFMGFVEILPARNIPDLVNERYISRVQTSIILRRLVQRVYAAPTLLSANGVIYSPRPEDDEYSIDWETQT